MNIIIKHAEFVSVFLQKPEGIVIAKVFKLDQSVLTIPSKMILKQQYNDNSTQWINKELTSLILTDSNFFHHVHIQRNGIFFCKKNSFEHAYLPSPNCLHELINEVVVHLPCRSLLT